MMNTEFRRVVIQDLLKSGCDWESGYTGLFNGSGNVSFHNWLVCYPVMYHLMTEICPKKCILR